MAFPVEFWYFLDENSSLWIVLIQMLTFKTSLGSKCPQEQKNWVKVSQPLTRRGVLSSAPAEVRNGEKQCPEGRVAAVVTVLEKQCGEKEPEGYRRDTPAPHLPSGLAEVPDGLVPAGAQPRVQARVPGKAGGLGRPAFHPLQPAPSPAPSPPCPRASPTAAA